MYHCLPNLGKVVSERVIDGPCMINKEDDPTKAIVLPCYSARAAGLQGRVAGRGWWRAKEHVAERGAGDGQTRLPAHTAARGSVMQAGYLTSADLT